MALLRVRHTSIDKMNLFPLAWGPLLQVLDIPKLFNECIEWVITVDAETLEETHLVERLVTDNSPYCVIITNGPVYGYLVKVKP